MKKAHENNPKPLAETLWYNAAGIAKEERRIGENHCFHSGEIVIE